MERTALERSEPFAREGVLAVDEHGVLGAVLPGLAGDRGDIGLVGLAEVGGEGVRDRPVLAHPRERATRVEASRKSDPDALAHRQGAKDDAARCRS